jgi:hypothetical protein
VSELATCQHDGVQQLMDLWVVHLGVREYFIDEVYWSLDGQRVTFFRSLDNYGCADHLRCHGDVEQERFSCNRRNEYQRFGQCCLELAKSFLNFGGP